MFSLDLPSSIQFTMPDWLGGIQTVAGEAETAATAVYDSAKPYVDPLLKAPAALESNAVSALKGAGASVWDSVTSVTKAVASPVTDLWGSLTSGVKWGIIAIGVILGLYLVSIGRSAGLGVKN